MKYSVISGIHMIYVIILIAILQACTSGRNQETGITTRSEDNTVVFKTSPLDDWEITNFGPQGPVYMSGENIILGMGDGCTGITYRYPVPDLDYRITLEAKRVSGFDFFCGMTFPAGKQPCTLIVGGWGGSTIGLSSIDGKDASENETTRYMKFENDKWYEICLEVKEASIRAWIDDSLVVNVRTEGRRLSVRPEVELSRPFGICSWKTTAALRNIRIDKL